MSRNLPHKIHDLIRNRKAEGLVVVAKANPSRGTNFQIAHFRRSRQSVDTLREFDLFQPTFAGAVEWVRRHYPSAHIHSIGKRQDGAVAAVTFECHVSDFFAEEREQGFTY